MVVREASRRRTSSPKASLVKLLGAILTSLALVGCVNIEPRQHTASFDDHVLVDVKPVRVSRNVLIVGDSEACAVGLVKNDAALLESARTQAPIDKVAVECKGGIVIQHWTKGKFKRALDAHPNTDVVLVFLGTNHYWQKELPSTQPMLDLMRERGLSCVWVGNPRVLGKRWPMNDMLPKQVEPTCMYLDSEQLKLQLWDGYHPDKKSSIHWLRQALRMMPLKFEFKEIGDE